MKKLFLALPLSALFFLFGCGGGGPSGAGGGGGGGGTGTFSNASLSGTYVYTISGFDLNNNGTPYREAGVFTADGNGNITSGTDDSEEASGIGTATSTGNYAVGSDGTGTLQLIFNGVSTDALTFAITLASSTKFYLIEGDSSLNAYGVAEQQDATAAGTLPSGSYAFRIHPVGGVQGLSSQVGQMTISAGTITGSEDIIRGGLFDNGGTSPLAISSGLLNAPSTVAGQTGRGSGTFTDSTGAVTAFNYYIVDGNNLRFLLNQSSGTVGIGRAALQNGAPYTTASFTGSYAFGSRGDDSNGLNDVATAGQLTASGGQVTEGEYDSVQGGSQVGSGTAFTGVYTVSSNGRVTVTLTPGIGSTTQQIYWLASPSLAYFISNDTTKAEDGIAQLQSTTSFSNASLSGQYAFYMDGLNLNSGYIDRVGWINGDGNGNLNWFEDVNNEGATSSGTFTGTYNTVAANGRATATVTNISLANSDITFYLVSPTEAYILQSGNGTGSMIIGDMNLQ